MTNSSPNIVWHGGHVRLDDRERLLGQQALTIWLTGLSGAGKSTLAYAFEAELLKLSRACYVLDGDNVRHRLNRDLGFSAADRSENIRRIAEVAHLMNDAGLIVITSFISPFRADRAMAKEIIGSDRYREVFVSTPLTVCETRDPKGLYKKARDGQLPEFTGISSPYEYPEHPDLTIDTSNDGLDVSLKNLMSLVSNPQRSST